jgi:acyl-CoA reductase-like NAD-dependent aldehyde dehydrogenase|tara:strand:- start:9634 stop:11109 length:1476 start_codon:yes stop_codon:yes gene_type:complete
MGVHEDFSPVHLEMLIDGAKVSRPQRIEITNPACTTEIVGTIARGTREDVNLAVAAAKAAQPDWARKTYSERASLLSLALDLLDANIDERANLFVRENGKTLAEARGEIRGAPTRQRMTIALAEQLDSEKIVEAPHGKTRVRNLPYGVVVSIVPWNSPLSLGLAQVVTALLAGNSVILKPPESCPLTLIRSAEMISGLLPKGLLNIVTGLPGEIGDSLTGHPDVGKIGFTGSIAAARKIMVQAAVTVKSVTFELGGNDAAIFLEDADLSPSNLRRLAGSVFRMTGQVCMAVKRIYVHQKIEAQFVKAFKSVVDDIVVGNGLHEEVTMGPLHTAAALARAQDLLEDARSRGADVIQSGRWLDKGSSGEGGHFMLPAIVTGLSDDAPLVKEEQFCAAIPIMKFAGIDEVIARANDTIYGLGGSVWSANEERALEVADRLETATIFVNTHGTDSINRKLPYGGVKQSGIGCKSGIEGLNEYLQVRTITTYSQGK